METTPLEAACIEACEKLAGLQNPETEATFAALKADLTAVLSLELQLNPAGPGLNGKPALG